MIDPTFYLIAYGMTPHKIPGGQELLLGEVIGALKGFGYVWLPFPHPVLRNRLESLGFRSGTTPPTREGIYDALYFGTPTIVNDKPLFEPFDGSTWTKKSERKTVRNLCETAKESGIRKIISGLGSGDISLRERSYDIEKGCGIKPHILCIKNFNEFTDILLEADLR